MIACMARSDPALMRSGGQVRTNASHSARGGSRAAVHDGRIIARFVCVQQVLEGGALGGHVVTHASHAVVQSLHLAHTS